jgi:hypothetical protein
MPNLQALNAENNKLRVTLGGLEKERHMLLQEKREWDQAKSLFEEEKNQLLQQISRSCDFVESREADIDAVKDVLQRGHTAMEEVRSSVWMPHACMSYSAHMSDILYSPLSF